MFEYVDDLLLAAKDEEDCLRATRGLLETTAELGYRVSKKKAQIFWLWIIYVGYDLREQEKTTVPSPHSGHNANPNSNCQETG